MNAPQARLQSAVSDRSTVIGELGQGGMAIVYLSHDLKHDLKHDRKVAIKVLHPDLGPYREPLEVA